MAIAFVNAASNNVSAASTIDCDAINATGGNTIIVFVGSYDGSQGYKGVTGVTDTAGNSYARAGSVSHGDSDDNQECWIAHNITGNASNVVTATHASTVDYSAIAVAQYSGLHASSAYDAEAAMVVENISTTTHTTNSLTTTNPEALVIGHYSGFDGAWQTVSASGGSTVRLDSSADGVAIADRIVASTGSYSITVTTGVGSGYLAQVRAFKGPTSGSSNGAAAYYHLHQ